VRDVILDPEHGHERLGTTPPAPFGAREPPGTAAWRADMGVFAIEMYILQTQLGRRPSRCTSCRLKPSKTARIRGLSLQAVHLDPRDPELSLQDVHLDAEHGHERLGTTPPAPFGGPEPVVWAVSALMWAAGPPRGTRSTARPGPG
jgi:hypothetical protein